jgi:hypothetical protein
MKHIFIFDGDKMSKSKFAELFAHDGCSGWVSLENRTKDALIEDIEDILGEKIES